MCLVVSSDEEPISLFQDLARDHPPCRPVPLTVTEYELLRVLSLSAGRVVTYDALLRQAWSSRESGGPEVVRAFVKTLRRKLGDDAARPAYIFNERGVGYRMAGPDDR